MIHLHAFTAFLLVFPPALATGDDKKVEPTELSKEERVLIELVNREREREKLPPLKATVTLTKVARAHSANMARQAKMEHKLDGKGPVDRADAAGYPLGEVYENLAAGEEGWTLEKLVKSWMESPRHKENLLRKQATETGVGLSKSAAGEWFYTQLYGIPKK